jgi:hypothetical protein
VQKSEVFIKLPLFFVFTSINREFCQNHEANPFNNKVFPFAHIADGGERSRTYFG